jgi:hypothetical protein
VFESNLTTPSSDLDRLVERWATLPDHIKAAVVALVNTTAPNPPPPADPKAVDDPSSSRGGHGQIGGTGGGSGWT